MKYGALQLATVGGEILVYRRHIEGDDEADVFVINRLDQLFY